MVDVPGQRGAELQTWAEGVADVMRQTHMFATRAGVTDIAFGHEVLDRPVLAARQQPHKTDRVMWFFTGTRWIKMAGRRPIPVAAHGAYVVEPGKVPHAIGCAYAAQQFLEQCGVTVTLKDMEVE